MAYERGRYVKDGDEVIEECDIQGRDATKGVLVHTKDSNNKSRPLLSDEDGVKSTDVGTYELLQEIRDELKEIKTFMKMIVN